MRGDRTGSWRLGYLVANTSQGISRGLCAWTREWTKQPRTRSRVRHAYHCRAFPSELPMYVVSPCGSCFERNAACLVPLWEGVLRSIQQGQKDTGDSIPECGSFHKGLSLSLEPLTEDHEAAAKPKERVATPPPPSKRRLLIPGARGACPA